VRSLDSLWQQVCAAPNDEDLRRVLGDALLDAGDPRGELIQLQSMPLAHQTPDVVERCNDLIEAHWTDWLGDMAGVLDREGTYFRHGFLDEITVRADAVGTRNHRELYTVRAVHPGRDHVPHFAQFVAELPHEPVMLELPGTVEEFSRLRATWSARGLSIHFSTHVLETVPPVFPAVEQLELSPLRANRWSTRDAVALIPQLGATFTHLTSVVLDCRVPHRWYPDGDASAGEALLAEAGRSPLVTIRR
jgi:uncharacterized protein (TIGR02996 family)